MGVRPLARRAITGILAAGVTAIAASSDNRVIESVKAMEQTLGVKIRTLGELHSKVQPSEKSRAHSHVAISPDGTAFAWSEGSLGDRWLHRYHGGETPFLTLESLKEGRKAIKVEGLEAREIGLSYEGRVIVATAFPLKMVPNIHWQLLAIERGPEIIVHDLTKFIDRFEVGIRVEDISVSGSGTLTALGTSEQIQVIEIPSGRNVYVISGRFPRLSPDGKRIALVDDDKLMIHSFADGSTIQLLKRKEVKGLGGWSPDGRFLLASAWTTESVFAKRQTIVDTTTGEYAVIGKLGEGDYGLYYVWASSKLLMR